MEGSIGEPKVDRLTVIGLGLLTLPLLTMWHEIGGHAAACVAQGGKVSELGAFYVNCTGLSFVPDLIVAIAGVTVDTLLALVAWAIWQRSKGDLSRLFWWYVAVSKGFVAAGYLLFSGVTGQGDLGTSLGGGFAGLGFHVPIRIGLVVVGLLLYWQLYLLAARSLSQMIGQGTATKGARQTIAHLYYATIGLCAVLVGLFNPIGIFITVMSAAASSFGGNAGMISVGFATASEGEPRNFTVGRNIPLLLVGIAVAVTFGAVLGHSLVF